MNPIKFKMKNSHKIESTTVNSEEIRFWEKEFEDAIKGAGWEKYIHVIKPIKK